MWIISNVAIIYVPIDIIISFISTNLTSALINSFIDLIIIIILISSIKSKKFRSIGSIIFSLILIVSYIVLFKS